MKNTTFSHKFFDFFVGFNKFDKRYSKMVLNLLFELYLLIKCTFFVSVNCH